MYFSPVLKSSPHCVPSPDGALVATLLPSKIIVRSVQSLETVNTISLPSEISGPVYAFRWSPSSVRLLVSLSDQIHVFSVLQANFHATIRLQAGDIPKPTLVQFGGSDSEVFVCSQFGIKFTIFDLETSKSVEINNPKFHATGSAAKGFSIRKESLHLAMLIRTAGKDVVSLHHPVTRHVQRSWYPETVDAQGIMWTPDGRWLVMWDSPSQGHKLLFYTSDGHLYRSWSGPSVGLSSDMKDFDLGAGIKFCQLSPDGLLATVCDHTRNAYILDMATVTESSKLHHPTTIIPRDTVQIWQEHIYPGQEALANRLFVKASQTVAAPTPHNNVSTVSDLKGGCISMSFDSSSTLLATRLEDSPSTVWIWDLKASELRAVLIFHSSVTKTSWHPHIRELLMVRCDGEAYDGLVFIWDPLSEGPRTLDFASQLPEPSRVGKVHSSWVSCPGDSALLLLNDTRHCILASLSESEGPLQSWQSATSGVSNAGDEKAEVSLSQLRARTGGRGILPRPTDEDLLNVDDTFSFKR